MVVVYHPEIDQGTPEWLAIRCGILTASTIKLILTPTLKIAANDKERSHLYELLAQRVTQYVEPSYVGEAMLRGQMDEIDARQIYSEHVAPVTECGFITDDRWGFIIGYSPDGLVGDDGLIEIKSRAQKYQAQTIIDNVIWDKGETIPAEYMLQCQTGLLVSGRKWLDFISYCGGMPMAVIRVYPDAKVQDAIVEAATAFEKRLQDALVLFNAAPIGARLIPTERKEQEEGVW